MGKRAQRNVVSHKKNKGTTKSVSLASGFVLSFFLQRDDDEVKTERESCFFFDKEGVSRLCRLSFFDRLNTLACATSNVTLKTPDEALHYVSKLILKS